MPIGTRAPPGFKSALPQVTQPQPPGLLGLALPTLYRQYDFLPVGQHSHHHEPRGLGVLQRKRKKERTALNPGFSAPSTQERSWPGLTKPDKNKVNTVGY